MKQKLPEGWEWKQIGEVAEIERNIITDEELRDQSIQYVGLEDIEKDTGNLNLMRNRENEAKSSKFRFSEKDILYGRLRPYLNKVATPSTGGICSTDIYVIRPVEKKILREYLSAYLRQKQFVNFATMRAIGANLPRVGSQTIMNFKILVPPLKTQDKIITILQKTKSIEQFRTQSNTVTQQLLQSVFLEMFGDPVKNPMGWEMISLEELVTGRSGIICGPFGSQLKIGEYVEKGIPVIGIDNVGVNKFISAKPKFITTEKASQLIAFEVKKGDVLMTRTGTVGRSCVLPDDLGRAVIGPNLLRISFNRQMMLPKVFSVAMSYFPSMSHKIKRVSPGATVAVLNTKNLKALKIAVPPMTLQTNFVNRLSSMSRLTDAQRQSNLEIATVNSVLMSNAFKGELVA